MVTPGSNPQWNTPRGENKGKKKEKAERKKIKKKEKKPVWVNDARKLFGGFGGEAVGAVALFLSSGDTPWVVPPGVYQLGPGCTPLGVGYPQWWVTPRGGGYTPRVKRREKEEKKKKEGKKERKKRRPV